jgi:hypothetical protein
MDPRQQYNERLWRRHMRAAERKVGAVAWALR